MNTNLAGMKSRFENSKAAYTREKDLVRDQIVSQKQFKETVMRYQTDSIQYFSFLAALSLNKMDLVSPVDGFIRQVFQPNGSFVSEGTPLVSLGSTDMILLTADLPQRYWQEIPSITSASFRPSGSTIVYRIEDFGGRMVARGAQVTPDNQFIPVTFEFRNQASFVAGSFAEVFLHGSPVKDQLLIPVSSILEEQGNHYVYVQIAGEYYQKRYIRPGLTDGAFISVLTGLQAGERVVSRGAIFLKASSQTTGSASHGHEH
jgi:RND family efflux transporter MFP subunit